MPEQASEQVASGISPTDRNYHLVVSAVAHEYFQVTHVIPAQELKKVQQEQEALRKQGSVPKAAAMCLTNPNTTTGLAVTAQYLTVLHAQDAEKIRQADEKKQKGIDTENSKLEAKVLSRAAEIEAGKKLLAEHDAGNDDYWKKKMKVPELKLAYKHLTKEDGKSMKKDQLIEAIANYFSALVDNDSSEEEEEEDEEEEEEDEEEEEEDAAEESTE